jgi:MFS family permease
MRPIYTMVALTSLSHTVHIGGRLAVMLYAVHLGASAVVVGLLAGLFNIVNVFTSIQVGRWIDRVGSKLPMLIGASMILLGAMIAVVWHDILALFIVSALIGTFYNFIFIAQQRLAGQYGSPADRVANFSILSLGQSASGTLAPVLAGFVIEHAGFTETFLMFVVFAALPIAGHLLKLIPFPPGAPPRLKPNEKRGSAFSFLREPRLRAMYIVAVLASSTWSIMIFLVPLYGVQIGLGASTIGFIVGAFSFATVVVRMVLPWVTRVVPTWKLLIGSLGVSGLAMALIPVVTGVSALTVLGCCVGLVLGVTGPVSQALVHDISPQDRIGEVLGLRVMLLNVSHAGVPMMTGAIGSAIGVGPVFWVIAGLLGWGCWMTRAFWGEPNAKITQSSGH